MNIEIICPLYNASSYILNLNKLLMEQKNVNISKITYLLTKSSDNTEQLLIDNNISYFNVLEFSHSLTREEYGLKSKSDIIVFISQDIIPKNNKWLYNLVKDIINSKCDASFSRQISKSNNIEKYTREYNYPDKSKVVSIKDINTMGLKTFFFSDASSAIKTEVFKKLNGYDHKDLPINEDMYFAYKLINNNYKIKYAADSVIYHSHKFKLKDLYKRYKLTGNFFRDNKYLNQYGTTKSGSGLAKYILKRAIKDKNIMVLFRFPQDMLIRFIGMKVGYYGKN